MTHSGGTAVTVRLGQSDSSRANITRLSSRKGEAPPGVSPLNLGAPERETLGMGLGKGESSGGPKATHACANISCALAKVLLLPLGHRCCV